MARRKKPEGETPEQYEVRQTLETIANHATRSEKLSWERKMDNLSALLEKLTPIEAQILDLMAKKYEIFDEITSARKEMVRDCVHPYTHLLHKGTHVQCKFCERSFAVGQLHIK